MFTEQPDPVRVLINGFFGPRRIAAAACSVIVFLGALHLLVLAPILDATGQAIDRAAVPAIDPPGSAAPGARRTLDDSITRTPTDPASVRRFDREMARRAAATERSLECMREAAGSAHQTRLCVERFDASTR